MLRNCYETGLDASTISRQYLLTYEYWQITEERGLQTLAVWGQFDDSFKVKKLTFDDHTDDVNGLP